MEQILDHQGLKVYKYGSEADISMQRGRAVPVPQSMLNNRRQGDSARRSQFNRQFRAADDFERVFESDRTQEYGPVYDTTSFAEWFPVDRRSGWATSIKMSMNRRDIAPMMATVVCCSTDIPTVTLNRKKCHHYSGFVNLAVATDVCVFDRLQANDMGINIDQEYLAVVNEALTLAANYIAVNGDEQNNVLGMNNNHYIATVLVDPPNVTNPIISLRQIAQFLATRESSVLDLSNNVFGQTYTVFLPMKLVLALSSTWVTIGSQQISMLSIMTGNCATCNNDPSVPNFRIIGMEMLDNSWYDGSSVGYMFQTGTSDFRSSARWWKPFSLLNLGEQTHGLYRQQFFGARVGSIEWYDLSKVMRLIFSGM